MRSLALSLFLLLTAMMPLQAAAAESSVKKNSAPAGGEGVREVLSFDEGWRFHPGDIPFPVIKGHGATYLSTKAGSAPGAAATSHDDSDWRIVNLPHDWAVEGPFDKEENVSQGYRPRGIAWYRKSFRINPADRGRHLELQIDGVSTHCTVWLNGTEVHHNNCGYTGFTIDLTPFARYGDDLNTVAIRVDAVTQEGWWYEGAGIYRHTRLVKRDPLHIVTDGVFAQPVKKADGSWEIPAQVTVENSGNSVADAEVSVKLLGSDGKQVVSGSAPLKVAPLAKATARVTLPVKNPKLWSTDEPHLYKVVTTVAAKGKVTDGVDTACGFRTIRFDAEKGFFLNEKPLKLQGTCNHMDHAGVGVAVPDSLWDFRIRKLKEMGSNAYRCSHNPPPAAFLDACDRLGMLVMDENRNFNCSPEYMDQLRWMVRRDRNHPSVMLWSVFNEEPMQGTEQGYEMVRRMTAAVKELDATRPVTAAQSGGQLAPTNVSMAVDVVGFNYQQGSYDEFHRLHPGIPLTSSEDTSAFMTRGEYSTVKESNVISSYDDDIKGVTRASWGATHRNAWQRIAERPFVAGGFVWTGFDYRGEPTPHQWPSAGSFFGCMDLCGFPKTAFFLHQAQWIKDRPVLEIVPHWNWKGNEGKPVRVMVMSNARKAELFLNGASLGEKDVDPVDMVSWEVPYAPGKLEVIARTDGKEIARKVVETTGEGVALELIPDRTEIAGDGQDALPVTVRVVDEQGRPVPTAASMVEFSVKGPVSLIGLGNGDPNCHEPEKGVAHSLFNGLGQAILRSEPGGSGECILRATSPGLKEAVMTLKVAPAAAMPSVPAIRGDFTVPRWRVAPASRERPDPLAVVPDNDMNTWELLRNTGLRKGPGWIQLRSDLFKPFTREAKEGGVIRFGSLQGAGEIWLDGVKVFEKQDPKGVPVEIPLAAGEKDHQITLLLKAEDNGRVGIAKPVTVGAPK